MAGDYPILGGGDVNLYSLFVERAQALVRPDGVVALPTPSGIAADKGAAPFFRSIATSQRLGALFDFENRKFFFADVHASFKFCTLVFGGLARKFKETRCAFFLHHLDEMDDTDRVLALSAADFGLMNPNTGAAPIFRSTRDLAITRTIYERQKVLVHKGRSSISLGQLPDEVTWPVSYSTAFHMTNDSAKFLGVGQLRARGFQPSAWGWWADGHAIARPLLVGRMIHQFDHRHASVTVVEGNIRNAAVGAVLSDARKAGPDVFANPQYWVLEDDMAPGDEVWCVGFRDIARSTDVRTMIAAVLPHGAAGNTLPLLRHKAATMSHGLMCCFLAMLNSIVFDFVTRQKAQSTHLNWYILEQLPVIPPARFDDPLPAAFATHVRAAGLMNGHHAEPTIADFVVPQVLALSYTAHDLAPFARDLGYVDDQGQVLPPIVWNDEDRRRRLAALDALFFYLYGLGLDDAAYVMDTFPIVRQQDIADFGRFRTWDDVLALLPFFKG